MAVWRRLIVAAALAASTAACDAAADRQPRASPPSPPLAAGESLDDRLGAAARPAPTPTDRNPFRFAPGRQGAGPGPGATLPPPDGLPELPLPLPAPSLRLLGIATEDDGSRTAVMLVGADLVLTRSGDMLSGRYTVGPVGEQSVELTDAVGERQMRLDLP